MAEDLVKENTPTLHNALPKAEAVRSEYFNKSLTYRE
jgi:hypothetical protein